MSDVVMPQIILERFIFLATDTFVETISVISKFFSAPGTTTRDRIRDKILYLSRIALAHVSSYLFYISNLVLIINNLFRFILSDRALSSLAPDKHSYSPLELI